MGSPRLELLEEPVVEPLYDDIVDDQAHFIGRKELNAVITGMKADKSLIEAEFEVWIIIQCFC